MTRLRVLDRPADLRAQLDAVDPRVAGVGDRVELDVVVAVAVSDQAALGVPPSVCRELRLDRPVRAGVVGRLEDEVVRRRVGVTRVDVAQLGGDVRLPPSTLYCAGLSRTIAFQRVLSSEAP